MKRRFFALVIGISLVVPVMADSWAMPKNREIESANGKFILEVLPSPIGSQLKYFEQEVAGTRDARPCRARLRQLLPGGKEKVWWSGDLDNKVAPVEVMVADSGRWVIGFDNWHSMGYGANALAVYGEKGQLLFRHSLEEMFPPDQVGKLRTSTSSRHWRRGAWLDEAAHELVIATEPGSLLVVDLNDGKVRTGGAPEIQRALHQVSGLQATLPLELAIERKVKATEDSLRLFRDVKQPMAVRIRAAVCLAGSGRHDGDKLAVEQATQGNTENRSYALAHLGDCLEMRAVPYFQQGMRAKEPEICHSAKQGMLRLGPRVGPVLIAMVRTREKADYRGGAAQVLGDLKYRDAGPALLDGLGDQDEYVALSCFRALEELDIPSSYGARFLTYLESGTKIDAQLARYFCSHRDLAAAAPLLKALQSSPKRQDSYSNRSAREDLVEALEFQTGAHLGQDPKAWEHFLQQRATTPQARGELLLSLGDSDGCLLLPLEANRPRLAQELVNRPRLVNQVLGPRLRSAKLDPGGSAVLLPREGEKLGLLRFPEMAEISLNQSDLGEDALSFSRNREWLLLRSSQSMEIVSMLTGISRARAIPRTDYSTSYWEISDDGTTILEFGTKTNIFRLGDQSTPIEFTGQERGNPALSPNGQTLAFQSGKGVTLVDLSSKKRTEFAPSDGSEVDDCRFLSNSESLVTWSSAGQLEIWNVQGQRLHSLKDKPGRPWGWAFSKDGFLLGLDGNRFVGWDGTVFVQRQSPLQNSLSFQGDHILTSGDDGWLSMTAFSTGKVLWRLPNRQAGETIRYQAALAPDGQHLATVGIERNLVQLWRLPGSDKADTDVSPELLQLQLQRATGRQLKNDQVVNLTLEYQQVVQRCIQLETAHRAECKVGR